MGLHSPSNVELRRDSTNPRSDMRRELQRILSLFEVRVFAVCRLQERIIVTTAKWMCTFLIAVLSMAVHPASADAWKLGTGVD